jgi:Cytochrome b subunit of the bc complex
MWRKNFLWNYIYKELITYPVYANLSYWWNFGVLSFVCLVIQVLTGIFLAMYYNATSETAFLSVEHIMRDINYGWLIRYVHANGASFFFLCVYLHMFRNIYYNSYLKPRELLWCIGMVILVLMILTAFLGYVLPWGQMSFWAATVITSLFSAVPVFGTEIVIWLWGGYSVDHATLNRFFSLHYLLPFILLFLVILHALVLHERGSTNPLGLYLKTDKIYFHPYYTWKDGFGIIIFLIVFLLFVMYAPNYLGHSDNYIMSNPLVTPAHIVPEWYFLPFYAILRSIPDKLGGILLLLAAIITLFVLPFITEDRIRNGSFRELHKLGFYSFVVICLYLGWLGGKPIEYPFLQLGQIITVLYFGYLGSVLSLINTWDRANFLSTQRYTV